MYIEENIKMRPRIPGVLVLAVLATVGALALMWVFPILEKSLLPETVYAGEDGCIGCHSRPDLQVAGSYINQQAFLASPHRQHTCTTCHGGNSGSLEKAEAHQELVARPTDSCGRPDCHLDKLAKPDVHRDQGNLACFDCHQSVEIHSQGKPVSCITCHADISG